MKRAAALGGGEMWGHGTKAPNGIEKSTNPKKAIEKGRVILFHGFSWACVTNLQEPILFLGGSQIFDNIVIYCDIL